MIGVLFELGFAYEIFDGINLLAGYAETFRGPTPNETSSAGPLNPHYWYIPNPMIEIGRASCRERV